MRIAILIMMMFFPVIAHAQLYAQGGITGTDSKLGGGHSISAEAGTVWKFIDANVGIFNSTQRFNNGKSDMSWSGLSATASAHYPVFDKITAFAGYQIFDNASDKIDGRYGFGLSAHLDNFKLNFIVSPNQDGWHNSGYDTSYAISIKYRFELR